MLNQKANNIIDVVSTDLPIGNKVYKVQFPKGDSYLESKEATRSRAAEAIAFRNICISLLDNPTDDATCVLDVGANIGMISLVLGQLSVNKETKTPISRIISFEPEPLTFECLKLNAQYFPGLVSTVNCALGERSGKLPFLKTPGSTAGSHVVTDKHMTGASNKFVEVVRLDDYIRNLALPQVGLIKIDVEGHEMAVLEGAQETIEKYNPWIYLEFNSWTLISFGGINPRDFLEYLMDRFQQVLVVNQAAGVLEPIKSKTDALAFLHNNLVLHGCVDDLVLRFTDIGKESKTEGLSNGPALIYNRGTKVLEQCIPDHTFTGDFSDLESDGRVNWRWSGHHGILSIINTVDNNPILVRMVFDVISASGDDAELQIKSKVWNETIKINEKPFHINHEIIIDQTPFDIQFICDASRFDPGNGDHRELVFRIDNFHF